jgi:hypothetical protein
VNIQPHRPSSWYVTPSQKRLDARDRAAQLQREIDEIVATPLCEPLEREERVLIREKCKRKLPVRDL